MRQSSNAAVLGVRLAKSVKEGMGRKADKGFFWADISCLRYWIQVRVATYMPFVNHRIGEKQPKTEAGVEIRGEDIGKRKYQPDRS